MPKGLGASETSCPMFVLNAWADLRGFIISGLKSYLFMHLHRKEVIIIVEILRRRSYLTRCHDICTL
ncbi:hypothetical protein AXF42_Ash020719 [Apostasia shenzhenica]|uniref:Uncharacterized protein n=1 Tax=Apostasia shenzhenica TaxID=1088818 RepID=A0A2H9ZYC4_9ASPA|nr:hypothetical protein AXF42_Ash020719 [Apostasia shenzhenica]